VFIRNDIGRDIFPEVGVETCLGHPKAVSARCTRSDVIAV
jgi:hypothetical protein